MEKQRHSLRDADVIADCFVHKLLTSAITLFWKE